MKNLYLLTFYLLIALFVRSQTSSAPHKHLSNYTQPAPNVAALGKYVDYPVGYYTGTPNISVPLHELKDRAIALPISLSYHASGIRVSEIASWVGLGWSLQAGGIITRSVRGVPDEGGYYGDSGIRKIPKLPYPANGLIREGESERDNYLSNIQGGNIDSEPDLYSFNFNGYGGKFVFDENRTARLLEEQDFKIAVVLNAGEFNWIITTPDGVQYYFGDNNIHETNSVYNNEVLDNRNVNTSSWLLTRIINPNTKDTISFAYTPETYSYFDLGSETTVYDGSAPEYGVRNACSVVSQQASGSILRTKISGLRLTSITSKNYTVTFVAKHQRQDLISYSSGSYPLRLDSIKIFNSQNQCLKQLVLSYSYFNSNPSTGASSLILSVMNGDLSDTRRLKLTSVKEFSGDGLLSKPAYVINYHEADQLPRRMSFDQDHWGYSNNNSGSSNDRFTPEVKHFACTKFVGPFANREPKWPFMQSFTIRDIKDPLGVITTFDFEPHTSTMMYPSKLVGGLRIRQITVTDSITGISHIRKYDYGTGGTLYNVPQYLIDSRNEFYFPSYTQYASYGGYDNYGERVINCLIKQSQSVVPLQDFQGNHIGYPAVKEIFGNQAEGGYEEYEFMADQYLSTSRLDMSNFTAMATVQSPWGKQTGLYGNGRFNEISPVDLKYVSNYSAHNYYPFAPLQVDLRRGKLLNEKTYDSKGTLIHRENNIYKENYNDSNWMRGFKFFRSVRTREPGTGDGTTTYNDAFTYYKLQTGKSRLAEKIVYDYKDGKEFTSRTNYGYESNYHTLQTSNTTVNSLGDSVINKTYYSFDYANNATGDNVFSKMKNRNMLLPVSNWQWKNKHLVSGSITEYKDFSSVSIDTFINPAKVYALETTAPLTTAQAGQAIALTGQINTLIPNSYCIEKANFNYHGSTGNIIGQKLINNKNETLIWDSKYNLPLAQIENAYYTDVAYSGFESTETGTWTYSLSSVVTDATAPTGTRSYVLAGNPISKSGLTSSKSYIISYWLKSGSSVNISGGTQSNAVTGRTVNNWTYYQVKISGAASIGITGTGNVDEVKLYPSNAQMTTYTYDPLLRLIANSSPNGAISYYEYDSFNRLVAIKDQYRNIVKAFDYNYGRLSRTSQ